MLISNIFLDPQVINDRWALVGGGSDDQKESEIKLCFNDQV